VDEVVMLVFLVVFATLLLALFTGFIIGAAVTEEREHEEAVRHGHAHFDILPTGERQFVWNGSKDYLHLS
jgi:hypothetical protein